MPPMRIPSPRDPPTGTPSFLGVSFSDPPHPRTGVFGPYYGRLNVRPGECERPHSFAAQTTHSMGGRCEHFPGGGVW